MRMAGKFGTPISPIRRTAISSRPTRWRNSPAWWWATSTSIWVSTISRRPSPSTMLRRTPAKDDEFGKPKLHKIDKGRSTRRSCRSPSTTPMVASASTATPRWSTSTATSSPASMPAAKPRRRRAARHRPRFGRGLHGGDARGARPGGLTFTTPCRRRHTPPAILRTEPHHARELVPPPRCALARARCGPQSRESQRR